MSYISVQHLVRPCWSAMREPPRRNRKPASRLRRRSCRSTAAKRYSRNRYRRSPPGLPPGRPARRRPGRQAVLSRRLVRVALPSVARPVAVDRPPDDDHQPRPARHRVRRAVARARVRQERRRCRLVAAELARSPVAACLDRLHPRAAPSDPGREQACGGVAQGTCVRLSRASACFPRRSAVERDRSRRASAGSSRSPGSPGSTGRAAAQYRR